MMPFDSSSLKFWESVAEWGFIFVLVGVVGEGLEIGAKIFFPIVYKKRERCLDIIGGVFWVVLVLALGVELLGSHKARLIADRVNSRLNKEAGDTRKDAADAIKQAGEANANAAQFNDRAAVAEKEAGQARLTAANVESKNLVLQIELEKLKFGRRINAEQISRFAFLTKRVGKVPIKIEILAEGRDTESFASDMRLMFTTAGFPTNSDVGDFGINREPTRFTIPYFNQVKEIPDLYIAHDLVHDATNTIFWTEGTEITNGVSRPVASATNLFAIVASLDLCLKSIGVNSAITPMPGLVKPGEFLIYIPVK